MAAKTRILAVDHHKEIRELLAKYLAGNCGGSRQFSGQTNELTQCEKQTHRGLICGYEFTSSFKSYIPLHLVEHSAPTPTVANVHVGFYRQVLGNTGLYNKFSDSSN